MKKLLTLLILIGKSQLTLAIEPQIYSKDKTPSVVKSLALDSIQSSRYFNLLVLGLDVKTKKKATAKFDNVVLPTLGSRSDSINIISFDLQTGEHILFSSYRGAMASDQCWQNANYAPPETSERYISNLFLLSSRANYIQCLRTMMEDKLSSINFEQKYKARLQNGRFAINGVLEVDVSRLKGAMYEMAKVALANTSTLNRVISTSGFQFSDLASLPSVVDGLRNRHDYDASGYQRAFNHTKFLTYTLGYVGKILEFNSEFFSQTEPVFNYLSSSLLLNEFSDLFSATLSQANNMSLAESVKFIKNDQNKYVSPIEICEFGPDNSALIFSKGAHIHKELLNRSLLSKVDMTLLSLPNPEEDEKAPSMSHSLGRYLPF
jgi:hypothetical protein